MRHRAARDIHPVLHVVRPAGGGMREHVLHLVNKLDRQRFPCAVVATGDERRRAALEAVGIPCYEAPAASSRIGRGLTWGLPAVKAIGRALAAERPHIVHCHGHQAAFLARVARLAEALARLGRAGEPACRRGAPERWAASRPRLVVTVHGWPSAWAEPWLAWSERWAAWRPDAWIAVSYALAGYLEERWLASESALHVVHNGLSPAKRRGDRHSRLRARRRLQLPAHAWVLACVGRLAWEKGPDLFLHAVRLLLERGRGEGEAGAVHAVLAGDGPLRAPLQEMAAGWPEPLRLRVHFVGRRSDLAELWPAFDAVVQPSRREGLGYAVLEALRQRRPVVAARVGGLPEIVRHRVTGLLVPPENPRALADACTLLRRDQALAARLARQGEALVRHAFRLDEMCRRVEAIYQQVLARPAPRQGYQGDEEREGDEVYERDRGDEESRGG